MPPFIGRDWDDDLEVTPAAAKLKLEAQADVTLFFRRYAAKRPLTLTMLLGIHRALFGGLFPQFAGFLRGTTAPAIHYNVTFGHYRGTPVDEVDQEIARLFGVIDSSIEQLDRWLHERGRADFAEQVLNVSAYVHCELIRIHPFVNGNGRTARKCIDYFCWRYGLRPPVIAAKTPGRADSDYLDAMRTYLQRGVWQHFADYLRPRWDFSSDTPDAPDTC